MRDVLRIFNSETRYWRTLWRRFALHWVPIESCVVSAWWISSKFVVRRRASTSDRTLATFDCCHMHRASRTLSAFCPGLFTLSLSLSVSRSPPLSVFVSLSVNGLDLSALDSGFNAVISNNILYALPVYCGYLTQGHKEMLQRIFKRTNRRGFTVHEYDLEALA